MKTEQLFQFYDLIRSLGIKSLMNISKVHRDILIYARGYMVSQCFSALSNIGFFEELTQIKQLNLSDYATKSNIDLKTLQSICDYFYVVHILDKKENAYTWNKRGKALYEFSLGVFDLLCGYGPVFQNLEAMLRKEKKYGKNIGRIEKYMAKGSTGITRYVPFPVVREIIKKYNFRHILDLGCGSGEFLFSMGAIGDDPTRHYYGIDISTDVIKYAREMAERIKIPNIQLEVCSIFELEGISKKWPDIEVLTCMFVMHEFLYNGREIVINLLKNIKNNFPSRFLIICELCKQPIEIIRKKPTAIAEHHLFHALSNQGIATFDEWSDIFKMANYNIIESRRFDFAEQGYFVLR